MPFCKDELVVVVPGSKDDEELDQEEEIAPFPDATALNDSEVSSLHYFWC